MATVREHLKRAHDVAAEHHRKMAAYHEEATGKVDDPYQAFHKSAKAEHQAVAQMYDQMCSECGKAMDADLNEIQPLPRGFSRVVPTAPGVKMVPRAGQKPVEQIEVDPEFEESFGLGKFMHADEPSLG